MCTLPAVFTTGLNFARLAAATLLLCCLVPASSNASDAKTAARSQDQGTIVPAAGGRLQFAQLGNDLILPTDDGATTWSIELPDKWIVESAARVGSETWISGRSADASIDDMFVARVEENARVELLPTPLGREHPRGRTNLLVHLGRVVGITWLEGDSQQTMSVRAAQWTGEHWGQPEVVAPPLGREQTHLDSIVLADGSWLAVWAAVDGVPGDIDGDDDIWWSRRTGRRWIDPERLVADNGVPDIYPHVTAIANSALVVWSWYDGNDYRLRLAALEGKGWTELPIESGRGTIPGPILALEERVALLSTSVGPKGTFVTILDASGVERERWGLAGTNDLDILVRFDRAQPLLHRVTSGETSPLAPATAGGVK